MRMKWFVICLVLLFVAGCVESIDPVTGEKLVQLDPNTVVFIDKLAEGARVAEIGGGALSVFWPLAGLVAGIAGGLVSMWRRLKPQVAEARKETELYYNTAGAIVAAIEQFKTDYPDDWGKLETQLEKLIGEKAEAVIRALRNLPIKE